VRGGGVRPASVLLELEGLVLALVVDGRAPDLVRGLVLGAAVAEGSPETQVEIARVLERIDQLFSVELRAGLFPGETPDYVSLGKYLDRAVLYSSTALE